MKRSIAVILSVLFVLSVASSASARMGMGRMMGMVQAKEVEGEIEAVNAGEKTITVKGMRGVVTATIDEKTVIKMGKEQKTLADLKVGQAATLVFETDEGKNIAKSIFVAAPAEPAEKKAGPEPTDKK